MSLTPQDWEHIQSIVDDLAEQDNDDRRSKLRRWLRENTLFFVFLIISVALVVAFAACIVPFWVEHWGSLQACPVKGVTSC